LIDSSSCIMVLSVGTCFDEDICEAFYLEL